MDAFGVRLQAMHQVIVLAFRRRDDLSYLMQFFAKGLNYRQENPVNDIMLKPIYIQNARRRRMTELAIVG